MTTTPPMDFGKSRFTITTTSNEQFADLKLMPGDIVAAEREYNVKASDLEHGASMEIILFMVWRAAKRKNYGGDYEKFLDEVEELNIDSGAAQGNPTQPAQ